MRKIIIFRMGAVSNLGRPFWAQSVAPYAGGGGDVGIFYMGEEQSTIVESYSLVSPIEDYEVNNVYPAYAGTSVSTASGEATSYGRVPNFLAGRAVVEAEAEAYGMDRARAWASAKSTGITATVTETIIFQSNYGCELDLPPGSDGYVKLHLGFWEGSPEGGDFLLTPKDGWGLVNLGTDPNPFYVLSKTFTSGTVGTLWTDWSVPVVEGRDYSFYIFVDADAGVIPEPTTLLLLGFGAALLRRRR